MAKKDFAHNKAPIRQEKKSGVSMLPFAIVFIAGLCFAGGYWVATEQHVQGNVSRRDVDARQARLAAKVAENNILKARINTLMEQVALWKSRAMQDAHIKVGDLHFYTDLPKQSVMPSPVVEPASLPARPTAQSHAKTQAHPIIQVQEKPGKIVTDTQGSVAGFRIQIASFRTMADAVGLQKKLNKAGFKAFVQTVNLGEKGQWFRACGGPYASQAEAEQHLQAIEAQVHVHGLRIYGG